MIVILSEINKKTKCFFHEKGQGIVEFALVLAFCAAIGMYARDAGFSTGIKEALDKGTPELLTAAIGSNIKAKWGTMDRNKLLSLSDNERRIKEDQDTLVRIAQVFLDKSVDDKGQIYYMDGNEKIVIETYSVHSVYANSGLVVGNYYDDDLKISAKFDFNKNYLTEEGKKLFIEALTGTAASTFQGSDTRYFYSNEMVRTLDGQDGTGHDGKYSDQRTVRMNFAAKDGKIDAVRVKINRGYHNKDVYSYVGDLDITVRSDGTVTQTISEDDLTHMDQYGRIKVSVSDSYSTNGKWYKNN